MQAFEFVFSRAQSRLRLGSFCLAACFPMAAQNVLTWHNDNSRTGLNSHETILTPANVNSSSFGKLFVISVDGKVDAQPLYVSSLNFPGKGTHNALFVETEHDTSYAFDADTGSLLWQVSLAPNGETSSDSHNCFQVVPEIGITSTPVIDPSMGPHGTLYAVAMTKDSSGNYHHRFHALDLTTGAEQFGGPVEVQASVSGSGVETTFNPGVHKQRAALLLLNGTVYTSWGSHCDASNYTGWIMGYDEATLKQTSILSLAPNGNDAGIWGAGAGPAADSSGNLFVSIGNGTFETTLDSSGMPSRGDYGNAFVRIPTGGGRLAVADYFTMANTVSESDADKDLGSGGLLLTPSLTDSQGKSRTLAVGGGKDGTIYVVDATNMGKFNPQSSPDLQQLPTSPIFSSPAWFANTLYYGVYGTPLTAYTFNSGSFSQSSQSPTKFSYPGATPSISSNGSSNGIVWAVSNDAPAVLHAYDATNVAHELYNSLQASNGRDNFGQENKFMFPTVANGKVYVPTTNGVGVLGLLSPTPAAAKAANGASFQSGAIAPGEIISISGSSLGPSAGVGFSVNSSGMVGTSLAGTTVSIGGYNAPILYASGAQANVVVPYEVSGLSQATVQVQYQGITAASFSVPVANSAPAVFTSDASGSGQAAALNQDNSVNAASNPAAGGSYVTLYITGGGQTNPPGVTGSVSGSSLRSLVQNVTVTVGGHAATVTFAGAAPGYVDGLDQLNIQLAGDTPSGPAQPVVVTIGGVPSPSAATLSVR